MERDRVHGFPEDFWMKYKENKWNANTPQVKYIYLTHTFQDIKKCTSLLA